MSSEFCPHCHQTMPRATRNGVMLPALKTRIFDFIERHPGLSGDQLAEIFQCSPVTFRNHVKQINDAMEDAGAKIEGARGWGYCVRRKTVAAA